MTILVVAVSCKEKQWPSLHEFTCTRWTLDTNQAIWPAI